MPSLQEMREELRELRKSSASHKPISRLRKADIATEIERLREKRETTAPVASTRGAGVKKSEAAVESIKKAKESEFPVKPSKKEVKAADPKPEKKRMSKSALRQMLDEMTSDEE